MATQEELIAKQFAASRQKLSQNRKSAEQNLEQGINRQAAVSGLQGGAAIKSRQKGMKGLEEAFGSAEAELGASEAGQLRQAQSEKEAKEFSRSERESSQSFGREERIGSQQFGAEQASLGRGFQREERIGSQQFSAAENEIGRQFSDQQRSAIQDFQNAQRLGAQDFASAESALGRQFTTEEREAIQAYQTSEAGKQREFATSERLGSQQFAAGESALTRALQESQFGRQFDLANQQFAAQKDQFGQQMAFNWAEFSENQKTNLINAAVALEGAGLFTRRGGESQEQAIARTIAGLSQRGGGAEIGSPAASASNPEALRAFGEMSIQDQNHYMALARTNPDGAKAWARSRGYSS